MTGINDKVGKLPGRVQNRFEIKEREIKSRQHLMLLPNTPVLHPPGEDADLMASHFIPRARCQSFVTSVAPYQTSRKQDPRKQIINNEIRRCYRKRNRAACLVCGRLFCRGYLSAETVTWAWGPQRSEIEQQEAGAGKRRPRSPGQPIQGPHPPGPRRARGTPLRGGLLRDTSWGVLDAAASWGARGGGAVGICRGQTHAVSEGWKHGRRPPHAPGDEGCSHGASLLG